MGVVHAGRVSCVARVRVCVTPRHDDDVFGNAQNGEI
jgi:hypothetical protein